MAKSVFRPNEITPVKDKIMLKLSHTYAEEEVEEVVDDTPEVMQDKDVFIGITNFGDSSIDYTIRVWVKNSEDWNAYLPMLERVKRTFEEENIEIPFNQLDVHLKKE